MAGYYRERYSPSNIALVATGRIDPDRIVATARRVCGDWPAVDVSGRREPPTLQGGTVVQQAKRFNQQAVGSVFAAPPAGHPDAEVARALARVLGGENSRFFWDIIQKGLAPRAEAYWLGYADCGMMMLDGLCLPDKAEPFCEALEREADKITQNGASDDEIQRVKNRRRTGLAVEAEAAYHRLLQVAEDLCDYDRPRTVTERLADVQAVTADRVAKYLTDWPIVNGGLFLSLGPRNWPEARVP